MDERWLLKKIHNLREINSYLLNISTFCSVKCDLKNTHSTQILESLWWNEHSKIINVGYKKSPKQKKNMIDEQLK